MYRRTCVTCRRNAPTCATAACAADTVAAGHACTAMTCDGYCTPTGNTYPLATAYFPMQQYTGGYCPDTALCKGTMFPELVM